MLRHRSPTVTQRWSTCEAWEVLIEEKKHSITYARRFIGQETRGGREEERRRESLESQQTHRLGSDVILAVNVTGSGLIFPPNAPDLPFPFYFPYGDGFMIP